MSLHRPLCFFSFCLGLLAVSSLSARTTGPSLPAPRLVLADGSSIDFVPAGDNEGIRFRAPIGSVPEGVIALVQPIPQSEGTDWRITFESHVTLPNVQFVQPVPVETDWRSYVIAPGVLYNGNRYIVSPQPYPPFMLTEGVSPEGPIVIADLPRLTSDRGYRVELAANALTIPAIGFCDEKRQESIYLGMDVYGDWGLTGVNIVTLPGQDPLVEVCLPVRRKLRFRHNNQWIDAKEQGIDLQPGRKYVTTIRARPQSGSTIPQLVTRLAEYAYEQRGTEPRRPNLGLAESARLIEAKLNAYNWDEAEGYYASSLKPKWRLHTGWVGGGVAFYAMAMSPDPLSQQRAIRMMDRICREALTPSGYFQGLHQDGRWQNFGVRRPGCRTFSLVRLPLECARDVLKVLNVLKERGEPIKPIWEQAARRNLEAIVNTAGKYGQLGYTVDFETGDVLWGNSACGSFGIETLVLGSAWFNEPRYLATAGQLAEYYVTRFVDRGITMGGVGDSLMAADSESNYALLAGLMSLYRATHDARYLTWARKTADLLSTWVLSYDAKLPPDSPLGKLQVQPRGAVMANTQNQHGAPGFCTASGAALLMLYEATGEERYLRMLEDIAQCAPQMVVQKGQEWIWRELPPGSVSERLMTMDGLEPNGHTVAISTWAELALLHMARELPAVYHNPQFGTTARFSVER